MNETYPLNDDLRVVVAPDEGTEDPRKWVPEVDVLAYKGPSNSNIDDLTHAVTDLGSVFCVVYKKTGETAKSLAITERYKRVFGVDEEIEISEIHGYSQGHWAYVVAVVPAGHGTPAGHIKTYRDWRYGDVFTVTLERRVTWQRVDPTTDDPDQVEEMTTWEEEESCGDVYFTDELLDRDEVVAWVIEQGWVTAEEVTPWRTSR